jgi:DNA cross-link repair 1A protein
VLVFRVRGRTIVHCGDMRYHASMPTWPGWSELAPPPASSSLVGGGCVDLVYLDTTYADPKHDFPVQEESCAFVSETIAQALAEDAHAAPLPDIGKMLTGAALPSKRKTLFLIGTYQIGKEKVLVKVATDCGLKVYANPQKLKMLRATDLPDVWTADEASTCVRIVPIFTLTFKSMAQTLDEARRKYETCRIPCIATQIELVFARN